ncbi:MAG: flagellar hook-length control protein FliK, partial [Alphaproteobacteria bacterium]
VSRDGQVTTHLVVERAETLDMLQRDARALERALQNAGLDTSEGGMKFSLKDQGLTQHQANDGNGRPGSGGGASSGGEVPEDLQDLPLHPRRRYVATTGLDIRI